ncbi:MAG: spore photoproduct lyase family protein [Candidatus Omnitrophota bacterium]
MKKNHNYYPEHIFVEKSEKDSAVFKQAIQRCPKSKITVIDDLSGFNKEHCDMPFCRKNLFIARKKGKVIRPCPCAKNHISCGYYVLSLGYGCPFECSYCYFQYYGNAKGLVLHSNVREVIAEAEKFLKKAGEKRLRIGTGEFSDSLALDHLSNYSRILAEFFAKFKNVQFELKTKSDNIENLEHLKHKKRIIISWSVMPERLIQQQECGVPSLNQRVTSAAICEKWGYKIGFHFDPIILTNAWKEKYKKVVDDIFNLVSAKNIAWISLGSLRFERKLKPLMRKRFSESKIIYEELLPGLDGKLRYFRPQRTEIYQHMLKVIRSRGKDIPVYLCMETLLVWQEVFGSLRPRKILRNSNVTLDYSLKLDRG